MIDNLFFTILGLFVILLPFSAVLCFESRLKGFITIFAISGAFHLSVAFITQAAHLFSYPVIFALNLALGLIALFWAVKHGKSSSGAGARLNWFTVSSFCVIFFFLFSLHYNYTGIVGSSFGFRSVAQSSYQYPMYSDEWVAVSLVDYSITSNSLPFVNPLANNAPFIDLLSGFHSLVAEVMLLLNLTPLTHYAWLAIFNGMLISLSVYLLLRLSKVSSLTSAISAMSVPFITSSGSLPGIWYLLPYNLSLTFLLIAIIGFLLDSGLALSLGIILSLIIYPPMIVFVAPVVLGIYLFGRERLGAILLHIKHRGLWVLLAAVIAAIFVAGQSGFGIVDIIRHGFGAIVRERLSGGIVSFAVWNVVPIFILPFAFFGLWDIFKRRIDYVLLPAVLGILFWIGYSFLLFDFVMSPSKVVSITAIFLIIASGFGIDWLYGYLRNQHLYLLRHLHITKLRIVTLLFFIFLALFFTRVGLWHKLVLVVKDESGTHKYVPSPPVTRYLTEDDLKLFAGIEGKRFIAPLWKGLVLGVATHNYPLDSKASTITNKILKYDDFMAADCAGKEAYAQRFGIDFAYIKPSSADPYYCPFFVEEGKSSEGLILYKIERNFMPKTGEMPLKADIIQSI